MRPQSLLVAAAVVLSAALINPVESAAQRQRWPGGNGGGRQDSGGGQQRESGGGQQRENGGGRQRENGGGQRDNGGARQQDSGRAQARAAQPRGGDQGNVGRRESPVVRENTPPPPPPQARTEAAPAEPQPRAQRRFPTDADRSSGDRGNVVRNRGDRGTVVQGGSVGGNVARTDGGAYARSSTGRVAVPRVGPPPRRYDDRYDRNVYGSYYGGRAVYGRYPYHGARNIYIVPYGRTYAYYPRYYYNPYAFGYGPAGRGHFYFDLHYNSYVWHPYSVYRYDSYGSYGYPIGELRLKVQPRDAQVFIDGYYAGRVDDFDGVFQSLRLEEGEYQVELVLPGYEPLAFDVRIFPGEKTTYEGDLIPAR
jgi:PEGA domain